MTGPCEPGRRVSLCLTLMAIAVTSAACVGGCRQEPGGSGTNGARSSEGGPRLPAEGGKSVGNSDPRGVDNQPDWDEMARELRIRVEPRMTAPLAADASAACNEMLDAVVAFYEATEPDEGRRKQRLEDLKATRTDDAQTCESETSRQAARCVTVLLGDRDSEFPWLLDQCSRAFPRPA